MTPVSNSSSRSFSASFNSETISSHVPWHSLRADAILEQLASDRHQGLTSETVSHRQQTYGLNTLSETQGESLLTVLFEQFQNPLIYILLAAALITAIMQEWVDATVILIVVLINAAIGFVQEVKATKAMEALKQSLQAQATVIRDQQRQQVTSAELVPGDIVVLQSGDKVPADLRLIQSRNLQIDESTLTGESLPAEKQSLDALDADTLLADRSNMVYSSTLVTFGTGMGVVVATGDRTEVGKIGELIASVADQKTPLTQQIKSFSQVLLKAILLLAVLTLLIGVLRGNSFEEMFEATISLMVAMIPEGLPAIVTVALAIGVSRMAARNAIIRKLPAVETLGGVTVICSDKTGTLTQNEMTVQEVFAGGQCVQVSGVGYGPDGTFEHDGSVINLKEHDAVLECLKAGLLCNDSRLVQRDRTWRAEGDPTEAALLTVAAKAGLSRSEVERSLPRIDSIPFESQYQYMATLHRQDSVDSNIVYLKGSIEQLLPRCTSADGGSADGSGFDLEPIDHQAKQMASRGLRVLAFARLSLPSDVTTLDHHQVAHGLTFLGLQGMIDPPRVETIDSVRACQTAGITVKMITGDHVGTAVAIGNSIGLGVAQAGDRSTVALSSKELDALPQAELPAAVNQAAVFARVTPEQKLRLVEALQQHGHIVAMTGDGSNDAPALQQANIGIAMGATGTEVAKEAADMILTDDNFATIKAAVEEGRNIFDNIIKAIVWTLPTNLGEGLIILVSIVFGLALPIAPLQILWINTVTAVLLGSTLVFEPKEPDVMRRSPRPPHAPLLTGRRVRRIAIAGLLLAIMTFVAYHNSLGLSNDTAFAQTAAVNALVGGEIAMLLGFRSLHHSLSKIGIFSNRWVWGGIALTVGLQLVFTYAPLMNFIFETAPISLDIWGRVLAGMLVLFGLIELDKWIQQRSRR